MAPGRGFSAQTLALLAALCSDASAWRHGYDLARQTELKSGTRYPMLHLRSRGARPRGARLRRDGPPFAGGSG